MKTLCIIDMQEEFAERENKSFDTPGYIDRFNKLKAIIRYSIKNNWNIIIVEFARYGPTSPRVLEIIGDYPYIKVTKPYDDGSSHILSVMKQQNISTTEFVVVGANTEACVASTVRGLIHRLGKDIEKAPVSVYMPATMSFNAPPSKYSNKYIKNTYDSRARKISKLAQFEPTYKPTFLERMRNLLTPAE